MKPVDVVTLFEEFVATWTSGEQIYLETLLERAGPDADELGRLVDAFLERAPRRRPTDESRQAIAAIARRLNEEPPLLAARVGARKRVGDVTAAIRSSCALPDATEQLVRSYYQRLEGGLLDPRGVSENVWSVLERVVAPSARKLALDGYAIGASHAVAPTIAFQRAANAEFAAPAAAFYSKSVGELPDELRRVVEGLFTGEERH